MKSQQTHLSTKSGDCHQVIGPSPVISGWNGTFLPNTIYPMPPLVGLSDHEWKWIASVANRDDLLSQSNTVEE